MATIEMVAKKRAESLIAINDSVSAIVEQLNHFASEENRLEVIQFDLGLPKHGNAFVNEAEIITKFSEFLANVTTCIDDLLAQVDSARVDLESDKAELEASKKSNDPPPPESEEIDPDSDEIEFGSAVDDLEELESDETESQLEDTTKGDLPAQRKGKRGRPKNK